MLTTLAVANYRSLLDTVIPLGPLNVVTGANASGKSNLYKALRLLAETAQGGVVNALAREGGLESTFWAGPEQITRRMKSGAVPVQGGPRQQVHRLRLGFAGEDFGYAIALGLPKPSTSALSVRPRIPGLRHHRRRNVRSRGSARDRRCNDTPRAAHQERQAPQGGRASKRTAVLAH